jgi:Recombinase zinc beta ribbon domain/Recombinase
VLALDTGIVTGKTAGQWLSSSVLGVVAEYQRRTTAERVRAHQVSSVERGVAPQPHVPAGLRRRNDGVFEVHPKTGPVMREAFRMVADGQPVTEARRYANEHGVGLSYHGMFQALKNVAYVGTIRFGKLVKRNAHEALIDAETFRRVQRQHGKGGRKAQSQELLARLGVLRCSSCGSAMAVGKTSGGKYRTYRCSAPVGHCSKGMSIMTHSADAAVTTAVKQALADVEGRASIEDQARSAERTLADAQRQLDALIRVLDATEPAAVERLEQATRVRDEAEQHVVALGGRRAAALTLPAPALFDSFDLDKRRAVIKAVVASATVQPGRGSDRVTVELA